MPPSPVGTNEAIVFYDSRKRVGEGRGMNWWGGSHALVHALGRSKHLCVEEAPVEMLAVRIVLIYVETGSRPEDAHNASLPRNSQSQVNCA